MNAWLEDRSSNSLSKRAEANIATPACVWSVWEYTFSPPTLLQYSALRKFNNVKHMGPLRPKLERGMKVFCYSLWNCVWESWLIYEEADDAEEKWWWWAGDDDANLHYYRKTFPSRKQRFEEMATINLFTDDAYVLQRQRREQDVMTPAPQYICFSWCSLVFPLLVFRRIYIPFFLRSRIRAAWSAEWSNFRIFGYDNG